MKTINRNMMRQMICAIFILLVPTSLVYAYPPDNAAVLYYRACLNYTTNSTMKKKLSELIKVEIGIDEEIKTYVQSNKNWIKQFVDAGEAPHCDWGVDYSEGITTLMPPYASLRNIARIVLVQAKIAAESTDYKRALDLCLSVHKASPHIADGGILISHLVGISINAMANQYIMEILPQISDNPDMLIRLKNQIYDVSERFPSVKVSINGDLRTWSQDITKEKKEDILKMMADDDIPKDKRKIIRNADEAFFKANKEYFLDYLFTCLTAVDLPYPQSYEQLEKLAKKPAIESKKNPDAIMSTFLTPALSRCLCIDLKTRTQFNAVKTALNLYIIRAKSAQLPDELPADLPKDLFSGKDFEYEKTKDGFVLRCRGKDLSRDRIYEYEFKVKK